MQRIRATVLAAICLAVALVGATDATSAPPDPPVIERSRLKSGVRKERIEADALGHVAGVNYEQQRIVIHNLRAKRFSAGEVRKAINRYRQLAETLDARGRGTRQRLGAVALYRLIAIAHEVLVEKVGATVITSAERLVYAEALERFDYALNATKRVAAFEAVLNAQPTPEQEKTALRGRQKALLLADQATPGTFTDALVEGLDTLRKRHPDSAVFREALIATGDHFKARGHRDEAHRYYTECLERFGVRARAASARLQDLH